MQLNNLTWATTLKTKAIEDVNKLVKKELDAISIYLIFERGNFVKSSEKTVQRDLKEVFGLFKHLKRTRKTNLEIYYDYKTWLSNSSHLKFCLIGSYTAFHIFETVVDLKLVDFQPSVNDKNILKKYFLSGGFSNLKEIKFFYSSHNAKWLDTPEGYIMMEVYAAFADIWVVEGFLSGGGAYFEENQQEIIYRCLLSRGRPEYFMKINGNRFVYHSDLYTRLVYTQLVKIKDLSQVIYQFDKTRMPSWYKRGKYTWFMYLFNKILKIGENNS